MEVKGAHWARIAFLVCAPFATGCLVLLTSILSAGVLSNSISWSMTMKLVRMPAPPVAASRIRAGTIGPTSTIRSSESEQTQGRKAPIPRRRRQLWAGKYISDEYGEGSLGLTRNHLFRFFQSVLMADLHLYKSLHPNGEEKALQIDHSPVVIPWQVTFGNAMIFK